MGPFCAEQNKKIWKVLINGFADFNDWDFISSHTLNDIPGKIFQF